MLTLDGGWSFGLRVNFFRFAEQGPRAGASNVALGSSRVSPRRSWRVLRAWKGLKLARNQGTLRRNCFTESYAVQIGVGCLEIGPGVVLKLYV
eukprot:scaffold2923_cov112-Isochrysis_galbana.AAC.7